MPAVAISVWSVLVSGAWAASGQICKDSTKYNASKGVGTEPYDISCDDFKAQIKVFTPSKSTCAEPVTVNGTKHASTFAALRAGRSCCDSGGHACMGFGGAICGKKSDFNVSGTWSYNGTQDVPCGVVDELPFINDAATCDGNFADAGGTEWKRSEFWGWLGTGCCGGIANSACAPANQYKKPPTTPAPDTTTKNNTNNTTKTSNSVRASGMASILFVTVVTLAIS